MVGGGGGGGGDSSGKEYCEIRTHDIKSYILYRAYGQVNRFRDKGTVTEDCVTLY